MSENGGWRGLLPMLAGLLAINGAGTTLADPIDGLAAVRSLEQAIIDVIAKGETGVVSIARVDASAFREPQDAVNLFNIRDPRAELRGPESLEYLPEAFGSGVVVAREAGGDERYVVTNYHVVRGNSDWSLEQV